ncbi:MAG: GGDEF domain-containing protein, partial [Thermoleophilaceae bacterium]
MLVVVGIPTFGWLPFVSLALAAWTVSQLGVALAVGLASGPRIYLLPLFIFPVELGCVIFPRRPAVFGTLLSALLVVATGFLFCTDAVLATPPTLVYPVATLLCTALWASAVRDADIESRSTVVADALTGALNRRALSSRTGELQQQGQESAAPVALILGDLDRFKAVNDAHGHSAGDAVLREVGARLRGCLGAFEPVYRIGGEEFVVLVSDADAEQALALAERLRTAVRAEPIEGIPVTISLGVTVTTPGQPFDYGRLFDRADAALYEAKSGGRDRVRLALSDAAAERPLPLRRTARRRRGGDLERQAAGDRWHEHLVEERVRTGSWLSPDGLQRIHMLDLLGRLDRIGHLGNVLILAAMVAAGPYFGWWPIVPVVVTGAAFQAIESTLKRWHRPEYALGSAWLVASAAYGFGYFLATNPPIAAFPLILLMNVGFSAVFPRRGVLIGGVWQALLLLAVAFGTGGHQVLHQPALVAVTLVLLADVTLIGTVVGQSAVEH